jgi:hypothetical protein
VCLALVACGPTPASVPDGAAASRADATTPADATTAGDATTGADGRSASDAGTGSDGETPEPAFAAEVIRFEPGEGGGYGADALPEVVLGPPRGGGLHTGSTDVLSLGLGGTIVVRLERAAEDGPGPDLLVFENPFEAGNLVFVEPGHVAVSADGEHFVEFPCDPASEPYEGCAGVRPVYANADDPEADPTNPARAGGDPFDLADLPEEVGAVRFVRIRDSGIDHGHGGNTVGFDLDAVAVVGR